VQKANSFTQRRPLRSALLECNLEQGIPPTAVMAVLNKMGEAYARRDKEAFLDLLVPDSDVFLYGTGADEKRRGLAEI
jgi:hypothetical protein